MQLLPLDSPERIQLVAHWLAQKENYQWLDFADGRQLVTPEWLKIGMQRGSYVLRLFTSDANETPIGVVGFSNINPHFKTANIWVVVGDKSYAARGYASRASSEMLTFGFEELGLRAIHTWIAEGNQSVRMAKRLKFRPIGRQRQCHYVDGRVCDRLWFDLLASEHMEIHDVRRGRSARADCPTVRRQDEHRNSLRS
jgi:RimJ/RimL family protein N-acetyltransferase